MNEISQRESVYSFILHFIVLDHNDKPIGFCQYYKCSDADEEEYRVYPKETTYSIDYLLGEESCLKKGIGKQIIKEITKLVFNHEKAKLIVVQPEIENIPSCKALESNGFKYDETNKVYFKTKIEE